MTTRPPRRRRVVTTYTPDAVRGAFEPWLTQHEPSDDGEMRMYCPLCEDPDTSHSPSASINPAKGEWNCLKTEDHGGKIDALARELRVEVRGTRRAASAAPAKPALPPPLEDQAKPVAYHDRLVLAEERPDYLDFLTGERGLNVETLEYFKVGTDSERITIPIRVRGKWRNVRRYLPHADGKDKMLNLPGFGSVTLAYVETFRGSTLPIVVTEGELDAMLLWQEARGRLGVATGTGGAGNVPRDLSALAGREVFVAYDLDDAGRAGAEKFAAAARKAGATAHVLDLARLNLRGKGADVSDYLLQHGGSVDALVAEMDRLRSADPDAGDDVLAAIEQMFLVADDVALDHLADGLTDDQISELTPPRFVVDRWLPRGFFSTLWGAPGVMKTFAILDLLRHVRAGEPWHTFATERGAVLMYEGEGLSQLQGRIAAWDERYPDSALAPSLSFQRFVDLTRPEGVAAIVRTALGFQARTGVPVNLIAIDPLVEFMTGEENGDGNEQASRGLRALAQYLDIAVLVGHHANAAGERSRGTEHLRMRAGAHIRMERADDGTVAMVQEKQKNAAPLAIMFQPSPVGSSLVLESLGSLPADAYVARKFRAASEQKAAGRIELSKVQREKKDADARELLVGAVRESPGIVQGKLLGQCLGRGSGKDVLLANLATLIADGTFRVEIVGSGDNAPKRHYLADGDAA